MAKILTDRGIEYVVEPMGDNSISDNPISPIDQPLHWRTEHVDVPLNGYRIKFRYYEEWEETISTPNPDPNLPPDQETTTGRDYPSFRLNDTLLEVVDPQPPIFDEEDGTELFQADKKIYNINEFAVCGIVDGTLYDALRVFDDNNYAYIPRLTKPTLRDFGDLPDYTVETNNPPRTPLDETVDPPLYPVDCFSKFDITTADPVPVLYDLSNKITPVGGIMNLVIQETITVTHKVRQPREGWGYIVKEGVDNSYYTKGYYPYLNRNFVDGGINEYTL